MYVDHRVAPKFSNSVEEDGSIFEDLGIFRILGNTLSVTLANGLVIADAVRIERVGEYDLRYVFQQPLKRY